jgi:hypothetical protein
MGDSRTDDCGSHRQLHGGRKPFRFREKLLTQLQAQLLACLPISRAWDIERQPQGCINGALFMQVSAAINVGTDIVLLLFPLPLLPLMKFNKKQRSNWIPRLGCL